MAKPFALVTDNHVRQPIVNALRSGGWDVVRAVDAFGERNDDEKLLEYAAEHRRVFFTSDARIHAIAHSWLREGRPFRMVYWWAEHRRRMSDGEVVEEIERISGDAEDLRVLDRVHQAAALSAAAARGEPSFAAGPPGAGRRDRISLPV